MDNSPKGAFFALEMNTSNVFQFTQVRTILIVLFWTFAAAAGAQRDSSMLLRPEQLNENDILAFYKIKDKEVIQSVSRVKEKPGDLPFSTWVITAEDILRYGFVMNFIILMINGTVHMETKIGYLTTTVT